MIRVTVLCLAVTATPALAQQVVTACAPGRVVSEMLDDRFGESEASFGITADGTLLHTLNAMENFRYSNVVSDAAQRAPGRRDGKIKEVIADTEDAIQVLTQGSSDEWSAGPLSPSRQPAGGGSWRSRPATRSSLQSATPCFGKPLP